MKCQIGCVAGPSAPNQEFIDLLCPGTGEGAAPFPQLRIVALTARAGRAMLGAILGGSQAGEQTLLKRLARRRPELFAGRVTCFGVGA
jgi:hypothetical protein